MIDSRVYELGFPDGKVEEYLANIIIENMLDQVRRNDWDASLFDEIISVRKDNSAICRGPGAYVTINGLRKPVVTAKGWSVQIKWKDGTMSWTPLSTVKASNPIDLVEYAVGDNVADEPAFNLWVG